MTDFTDGFASRAKTSDVELVHEGRTFVIRDTDAENGSQAAYLEVALDGKVIGYFLQWANYQSGAVHANMLGIGLPSIFDTVEDALDFLAPATR